MTSDIKSPVIVQGARRKKWVISDTHFSHANILTFKDQEGANIRNFSSVDEMDECMIDNWNSVVRPGDIVYHLGDVTFDKDRFKTIWTKLKGSKRLTFGNHDDPKFLVDGKFFKKTGIWRFFGEYNLILSHVPIHPFSLMRRNIHCKNVHGHIHEKVIPDDQYVNVSVERINYTPVDIESLAWYP